jgi:putative SOS response-associated peptidase YedK
LPPDSVKLAERFGVAAWTADPSRDRFRTPGDPIWAITNNDDARMMQPIRWGLVPSWSKWSVQTDSGAALANPSFRYLLKRRRCLIPVSAYSRIVPEHRRQPRAEYKLLYSGGEPPFAVAGIYDVRIAPSGEVLHCCAILTVPASGPGREEHMPMVLTPALIGAWLSGVFLDDSAVDDLVETLADRQPKHLRDSLSDESGLESEEELRPIPMQL